MCKIIVVEKSAATATGISDTPQTGFDENEILLRALESGKPFDEMVAEADNRTRRGLKTAVEYARPLQPAWYADISTGRTIALAFVMVAVEGEELRLARKVYSVVENEGKVVSRNDHTVICPPDCSERTLLVLGSAALFEKRANWTFDEVSKDWLAGLRSMIEFAIEADPESVGPPIDVLRLDTSGVTWLARKKRCEPVPVARFDERLRDVPSLGVPSVR
jgi:hypothetical protein